jgi:hypothetical protein
MRIEPTTSTTAKTNRLIPFRPAGRVSDLKGGISMVTTIVAVTARLANIQIVMLRLRGGLLQSPRF